MTSSRRLAAAERPHSAIDRTALALVVLSLSAMLEGVQPFGANHGQDLSLVVLSLAGLLCLAWCRDPRRLSAAGSWSVARWWGALLAWMLVAAAASGHVFRAMLGAPGGRLGFVACAALATVSVLGATRSLQLRAAIEAVAPWFVLGESALALWQASSGLHPAGTALNSSYLGLVLVLLLPVVLRVARSAGDPAIRPLAWTAVVAAVAATLAGEAYYALVASATLVAADALGARALRGGRSSRSAAAAAALGFVVVTVALALTPQARSTAAAFAQDRSRMWRPAAAAIVERPLLGYGPDGFRDAAYAHMRPEDVNHGWLGFLQVPADPHNAALGVAVATGIPGLLLASALLAAAGASWRRQLRAGDDGARPFIAGSLAYGVGLLTTAAPIQTLPIAALVVAASFRLPRAEGLPHEVRARLLRIVGAGAAAALTVASLAGLASGATYLALWRVDRPFSDPSVTSRAAAAWRVDPYLWYRSALDWREAGAQGSVPLSRAFERDLASMREAVALEPDDPVYLTELSRALTRSLRFEEARETLQRALRRFPASVDARLAFVENAVAEGSPRKAGPVVEHLLRYEDFPEVHWAAALYYREIGDEAAARKHEAAARGLR